jgi:hypothetical protein
MIDVLTFVALSSGLLPAFLCGFQIGMAIIEDQKNGR